MDTVKIHYLATKTSIITHLQSLYTTEGVEFIDYSFEEENIENTQYLLLVEPFVINSEDYAVSKLWKPWLIKNAPHVHLIVATFTRCKHSNFLNLADLPFSLSEKLKSTYPVAYFVPEYCNTIVKHKIKQSAPFDPWYVSLPLSGQDMTNIMTRFIEGHDKNNSYFQQLGRLRDGMIDLAYWQKKSNEVYKEKVDILYENMETEWELLLNRWNQYKELMPYLPFYESAKSIQIQMEKLEKLIESTNWENKKTKPNRKNIEIMLKVLDQDFLPYIYSNQI